MHIIQGFCCPGNPAACLLFLTLCSDVHTRTLPVLTRLKPVQPYTAGSGSNTWKLLAFYTGSSPSLAVVAEGLAAFGSPASALFVPGSPQVPRVCRPAQATDSCWSCPQTPLSKGI